MNGKAKKSMRKVLPVGIAMGILFSTSPVTEYKVKADVDTFGTVVTTLGSIYDAFGKEAFTKYLEEVNAKNSYDNFWENVTYMAPTFKKGEFGITVFDYYKNQDFSQKVKIAYPNGKVEYKTIKHGQQLRIKDAGTIVDLTPDEPELSKHNILYITQKQLDEGKTGVSLTNFKTYYLESDNSGRINELGWNFVKKQFPNAYHPQSGLANIGVDEYDLFNKLPEDKRMLGTSTSKTVGKEALSNYVTNDSEAREDLNNRLPDILADRTSILETPIALPWNALNDGKPYQIIPYKKGTNKVLVKTGSKYLSGKEGNALQYSDSIGDDEVFELVQTGNSNDNKFQFYLKNKNGVSLAGNQNVQQFGTDWSFKSEIRFTAKNNNEIHNWLRAWYPGKENEKQKYEGIQIIADEKDPTKQIAKDSSGNVIKNSWVNRDGNQYYAGSDGILLTGWHEVEGKTYYFELYTGLINTNGYQIDGKYYNFNDDGSVLRSAWKEDQNGLHYSDDSGAIIKEGLQEIDGKIYYFQNYKANKNEIRVEDENRILHFSDKGVLERASRFNGEALNNNWETVIFNDKVLVFGKDGSIRKNGVSKISLPGWDGIEKPTLVYYSLEEGPNYTGWKEVDGKKYHFDGGRHFTFDGNETIDGIKYYFNHEGQATQTGFVKTNGKTYYYNDKGEMQTGWQKINDKWHSFEDSGEATVGKFTAWARSASQVGWFDYYAKDNGEIYVNETVSLPTKNGYKKHIFDSYGHFKIDWNS
ncbi:N-acetylmuramoyl-L-alanine amidase family protein [Bacillus cereus]|uniref:Cell wall-binding protein n=1 Tax=Bacillus cereus TaxID=1396 RepID=A0A2A7HZJ2_BACCE|nr:cell wall-binding protein [Bacillus cereus]PEC22599.1 cell wall-binding protein [Bacillus cereus]